MSDLDLSKILDIFNKIEVFFKDDLIAVGGIR